MLLDNLPVILSLLAGFVVCVAMFVYQYNGVGWLLIVLGTLLLFYIFGACLKRLYKVVLAEPEEIEENEAEEDEESEDEIVEK